MNTGEQLARLGVPVITLPGLGHNAHVERPSLAVTILDRIDDAWRPARSLPAPTSQREAHDDLAVPVDVTGRREPEPLVEPGRAAGLRDVAGRHQLTITNPTGVPSATTTRYHGLACGYSAASASDSGTDETNCSCPVRHAGQEPPRGSRG
jgi:hypothetical protein